MIQFYPGEIRTTAIWEKRMKVLFSIRFRPHYLPTNLDSDWVIGTMSPTWIPSVFSLIFVPLQLAFSEFAHKSPMLRPWITSFRIPHIPHSLSSSSPIWCLFKMRSFPVISFWIYQARWQFAGSDLLLRTRSSWSSRIGVRKFFNSECNVRTKPTPSHWEFGFEFTT